MQQSNKRGETQIFSTAVQGGIFESVIRLVTRGVGGIPDFQSNKDDGAAFDFEEKGRAGSAFKKAFGFDSRTLVKADAKRTASGEAIRSLIGKT